MAAKVSPALNAIYDILITDADGQHLAKESFKDLDAARRQLPALAAQYPGTKVTLWNRNTRAILAETAVIGSNAPHGCCRFADPARGSSCCSSFLPSRRSPSNDTWSDSLGAALFGPTGRLLQLQLQLQLPHFFSPAQPAFSIRTIESFD
jgi:hypothetical protein